MTENVPGLVLRSTFTQSDGTPMLDVPNTLTTPASPFNERWGGWYVTGKQGPMRHMGNLVIHAGETPQSANLSAGADMMDLSSKFETDRYLSPGSDIVALMVFAHQVRIHNLLTQANYQTRIALNGQSNGAGASKAAASAEVTQRHIEEACEPLVKEMLFCHETPLPGPVTGSSTFTHDFSAAGPRDKKNRSLRDFDLSTRLFKYPCSYLIYTDSFAALPQPAKDFIFRRLWDILTGAETSPDFNHLTVTDRKAIVDILRDTVKELPAYWKGSAAR